MLTRVFLLLLGGMVASLSPVSAAVSLRIERVEVHGDPAFRLFWEAAPGTEYDLQWSDNLTEWQSLEGFPQQAIGDVMDYEFRSQAARKFFRLVVLGAPESREFVAIPGGVFKMGDHFGDGILSELPVHEVNVSTFSMGRNPVSWDEWQRVYNWAADNGYQFDNPGAGKAADHPVQSVSWHDAVKWCNARSEMEGLDPVFYIDDLKTQVYRSGQHNVTNGQVRWNVNGYRLPTEAEWEKAARGGLEGRRFPWGDTISHSDANYWADFPPTDYDESYPAGYHPDYSQGSAPYTNPADAFAPNGYGLHDMADNVWEYCWDWYDGNYYANGPPVDPQGPESGSARVIRSGSWVISAWNCRVSDRFFGAPTDRSNSWGFRLAKSVP